MKPPPTLSSEIGKGWEEVRIHVSEQPSSEIGLAWAGAHAPAAPTPTSEIGQRTISGAPDAI